MIKKYNQFVKENIELSNSSARIYIDSDEVEMFATEPVLQKLISDKKVSLLPPELWFEPEDKSTIDILKGYFPDVDFMSDDSDEFVDNDDDDDDDEYKDLSMHNPYYSNDDDDNDDFGFESPFCKSCKGTGCKECDGSGMERNSI
jgi:hypothetical protein